MFDETGTLAIDSAVATEPSTPIGDGGTGGTEIEQPTLPVESPVEPTTETTVETPPETPSTEETPAAPSATDYITQPVALPQEIRKLAADKELMANPAVAAAVKVAQSAYDRLNAYTTHFPTVADAKKFSEAFPGGVQDALTAQQRSMQLDESDTAFYSRDAAQHRELASTWAKDDPEAFATLTRSGLEVLAETQPEAYRTLALDVLEQTLGLMQQQALLRSDSEAAQRINQVHQDIFGRKPGEQPRTDPRDAAHKAREASLKQSEERFQSQVAANFANESNKQAGTRISQSIDGVLNIALKTVKITPAARTRMAEEIYDNINKTLLQDKGLDNQLKAIAQAGIRSGQFSPQQQQQWINAIYAKARGLVQSTSQKVITQWTQDFLGMKKADTTRREQASTRTDVTGGGSPEMGLPKLTGKQLLEMSDEEFRNVHPSQLPKDWKKQMQDARFARH